MKQTRIPILPNQPPSRDIQQRAIEQAISDLQASPLFGGNLTEEITTPATPNTDFRVAHKLPKSEVHFFVATPKAACSVYLSPNPSVDDSKFINLRCSVASVKLRLFVF